jgi:maltose O-acetyltransferase
MAVSQDRRFEPAPEQDLKAASTNGSPSGAPKIWQRLYWAVTNEVALLHPRALVAETVSRVLPQHTFNLTRTLVLRRMAFPIGPRSRIMGRVHLTGRNRRLEDFSIGSDCVIAGPLHVDLGAPVRIGDRVHIGQNVVLLTVSHAIGPSEERCGGHQCLPVTIHDGAWLGSRVTILPGVTIGAGAVVGHGAVVTRSVAPNTLVGGVPAKMIEDFTRSSSSIPPSMPPSAAPSSPPPPLG